MFFGPQLPSSTPKHGGSPWVTGGASQLSSRSARATAEAARPGSMWPSTPPPPMPLVGANCSWHRHRGDRGDPGRPGTPKKEVLGKMWTAGKVWDGDDSRWLFVGRWGSERLALEETCKYTSHRKQKYNYIIKECWEMTDQQWLSNWHTNGFFITWEVGFQVLTGHKAPGIIPEKASDSVGNWFFRTFQAPKMGLQDMGLSWFIHISVAKNWDTSLI